MRTDHDLNGVIANNLLEGIMAYCLRALQRPMGAFNPA